MRRAKARSAADFGVEIGQAGSLSCGAYSGATVTSSWLTDSSWAGVIVRHWSA